MVFEHYFDKLSILSRQGGPNAHIYWIIWSSSTVFMYRVSQGHSSLEVSGEEEMLQVEIIYAAILLHNILIEHLFVMVESPKVSDLDSNLIIWKGLTMFFFMILLSNSDGVYDTNCWNSFLKETCRDFYETLLSYINNEIH